MHWWELDDALCEQYEFTVSEDSCVRLKVVTLQILAH